MSERDVWLRAAAILADHGELTSEYILDQLSEVLDAPIAVEDWRRIAAAVDAITGTLLQ